MVATFSPHRDAGGTLHLASHPGLHHVDASSAIRQLRRSLSRSPSKSSNFTLIAARTTHSPSRSTSAAAGAASPYISSPLSPSRRASQSNFVLFPSTTTTTAATSSSSSAPQQQSPLFLPYPSTTKITRPVMRRARTSPRSPVKRVLNISTDQGNAAPMGAPIAPATTDDENRPITPMLRLNYPIDDPLTPGLDTTSCLSTTTTTTTPPVADAALGPRTSQARIEKRRSGPLGPFNSISPLKRSDGIMNLDQASRGSPSAKRRSVHAAAGSVAHTTAVPSDFNIFDTEISSSSSSSSSSSPSSPPTIMEESTTPPPILQPATITTSPFTTTPESPLDLLGEPVAPVAVAPSPLFNSSFPSIPKRSSSLRRSTLQQRQSDRPLFARSLRGGNELFPSEALGATNTTTTMGTPLHVRPRMSLDHGLFQSNHHDNNNNLFSTPRAAPASPLFASSAHTGNLGMMPTTTTTAAPSAHPLSRTITQSSSSSSLADESPTHEPSHQPERPRQVFNFSKSLPAGATRPTLSRQLTRQDSASSTDSFATPENYKLVKPLPAAFMSTGLISKKNRNAEDPHAGFSKNMPDTPCKRPLNVFPPGQQALPERPLSRPKLLRQSYAVPASPFNPPATRPKPGPFARGMGIFGSNPLTKQSDSSRRNSFVSIDGDDRGLSQSPSAGRDGRPAPFTDADLPPTPTKQSFFPSRTYPPASSQIASLERLSEAKGTSPRHTDKFQSESPRTPHDHLLPPDPSGLSISNHDHQSSSIQLDFNAANLPATPTGPRDSFPQPGKRPSLPLAAYHAPDVDSSLWSRFDKVELVGTGEFSQVYRVAEPHNLSFSSSLFSLPDRVWAVKKAKHPYSGLKDRERRIREVDILKSLTNSDHIISFVNSWEENSHLYIQTEFCEEGSLDVFLAQVGLKARLDDFRIWKILLEVCVGLKHIHDSGIIHLDLKPANILITFEGVLKIADFGMATRWPAEDGIDGEGDREYIGPEILMGRYDKPADIFSLGLIIFEIAGNVELPDNGLSWQKLRNGDMSDVPSLTWSSETSIYRDASGNPVSEESSFDELCVSDFGDDDFGVDSFLHHGRSRERQAVRLARSGELIDPPNFMVDANHAQALDKIVRWMISPEPADRPTADQILDTSSVQFVERRRRAGATIFEGNWGPADEILAEDAEMIDV
ncbi:hypothetical protein ASPZODRAFT_11336 [Penicilliopsis zonata CBS 506.65]|uniref:Protein kinase domain-containing protein n=1 Tax=Penicilliopsis zonata CBS 506.65 TaxID=1073090 RepID=A0A1L9STK4_9EURO|nr:hypothetical protein ASPZODRAFT_11336 [Penicilliopsis zonata CBS 506.65]OJJ50466.1 hypothetical protein ASPZODRAFT_11336 [Penicilliopsis zonata CBS 506.65]